MAEEPLVLISDKLSSDIGHPQTKPRHRKGYGVWVTQNAPAKWKKRPLNFQALEYRRSGSDTTLVLCQGFFAYRPSLGKPSDTTIALGIYRYGYRIA